jgi:N-acetylmuramoyl-L-alanine amidase
MLVSIPALAQGTPEAAVADAVANSGVFPAGTTVVSTTIDGASAVVDLSVEAAPMGLGDAQADDMVKEIVNALGEFPDITAIEVTVAGQPLWTYLPASSAPSGGSSGQSISAASAGGPIGIMSADGVVPPITSELSGKLVALHPSHGSYWHQGYNRWFRAMRTLCGPNPAPPRPPGWNVPDYTQSVYQPSNYYYWTAGYQWGSFFEDDRTPEEIRFLRSYCLSSGATVVVSRELDKGAGDFPVPYDNPNTPQVEAEYPNLPADIQLPKWRVAAKYNLEDKGYPQWVWDEPLLTAQTDKDIRARPYMANYHMQQLGLPWQDCVSFSLHTNAAGAGTARGTEIYWYTSMYPYLQSAAIAYCTAVENRVINAIKNYYDGFWAEAMYQPPPPARPEWPTGVGTYRGYDHDGPSTPSTTAGWQDRGVKTSNFGEIREAKMPAALMEMLFHDDWKFYPDHVFALDPIFQSTAAWGMYEGICNYFGATPKPRLAATVQSVSFPTLVGPNAAINGTVTVRNEGQAWCRGNKWVNMVYFPYTVWKLAATGNDQIAPGAKIELDPSAVVMPSETATFSISAIGPATTGLYTTEWQMLKEDARGGSFGGVASAQIQVDADPPVITISSPAGDVPYGCQTVDFDVTDAIAGVASVSADIDGAAVSDGQSVCGLALGSHTLTVTAVDGVGNSATATSTFNVVNTAGKTTAGGWIELADKKGTCGFVSEYVAGDPAPQGNVTYQDHDTGMTVHSVELVAMGIIGNQAWIFGTCTIEGEAGHTFRIDVVDNGEPGSTDEFHIILDTGYGIGGTLGGGNVTIH